MYVVLYLWMWAYWIYDPFSKIMDANNNKISYSFCIKAYDSMEDIISSSICVIVLDFFFLFVYCLSTFLIFFCLA